MAKTISATVENQLRQTLSQWRQWQCDPALPGPPEFVSYLGRGAVNCSVLVQSVDQRQFVVRITHHRQQLHHHSSLVEWRALQNAASNGIAPAPRYLNPDLGTLVCDYLEPDTPGNYSAAEVGKLLASIHQLPPVHARLQLSEAVQRYQHHAARSQRSLPTPLGRAQAAIDDLLTSIPQSPGPVFCHNDLLQPNRLLSDGRLYALDWEYSAMGEPWFDLAAVAAGDALDQHDRDQLMAAYLGIKSAGEAFHQLLSDYMLVYRYLELLWYFNLEDDALRLEGINEQRLAALEQNLSGQP